MRFWMLDKIRSFQPDVELAASKNVTLTEEYLADHFPEFPVLPGVFMLEAATQAGAWLLRLSENFAHSVISLKEAKNIKYADFVAPGQTLDITVSMLKKDERLATFKVEGREVLLGSNRRAQLLPVQTSRDHQVQHQEQVALESHHDALAEAPNLLQAPVFDQADGRGDRAQQERAAQAYSEQPRIADERREALDVDRDIGKLGH